MPYSRRTKCPIDPRSGRNASATDPATWVRFDTAVAAADRYAGVGFVLTAGDPYCGIDIDNCLDEGGGFLWGHDLVQWLTKRRSKLKAMQDRLLNAFGCTTQFANQRTRKRAAPVRKRARRVRINPLTRSLTVAARQSQPTFNWIFKVRRAPHAFLVGTVDEETFNTKQAELRGELALVDERFAESGCHKPADVAAALAVYDFSQNAAEIWRGSKMLEKREILESLSLNRTLGHLTLALTKRKPFDVLAEGLVSKNSRDDWTAIELFRCGVRALSADLTFSVKALAAIS